MHVQLWIRYLQCCGSGCGSDTIIVAGPVLNPDPILTVLGGPVADPDPMLSVGVPGCGSDSYSVGGTGCGSDTYSVVDPILTVLGVRLRIRIRSLVLGGPVADPDPILTVLRVQFRIRIRLTFGFGFIARAILSKERLSGL